MAYLNEQDLRRMMLDPRYQRSSHPEHEAFARRVAEGFRQLYGDAPAQTDAAGRLSEPQPMQAQAPDGGLSAPSEVPNDPPPLPDGWTRSSIEPRVARDPSGRAYQWWPDPYTFQGGKWKPAESIGGILG